MKTKKIIKSMLIIVFTTVSLLNFTNAKDYEYTNLDINADVLIDWTINVLETYTANFFVKKHGIFRTIPLNYSVDWNKFHIDISNINVEWKKFTTQRSRGEWTIKIWDPDKYVYWKVDYPILYTVYGLIRNFSGMWYSELYWNIVGHQFDTSIWNVTAVINLPKPYTWFKSSDFLITADWVTKTVDQFQWSVDWSNGNKIIIKYDKWLSAYHWITLAVKFPNNYFNFDDNKQAKLLWNARIWIIWGIKNFFSNSNKDDFIFVLLILFFISYFLIKYFVRNKKDFWKWYWLKWKFKEKYKVIVQYAPPKWLNSAEVWLLFHRNAKAIDMLSLIYKWAAQWLVSLSAEKEDRFLYKSSYVVIKKNKDIPEDSPDYEKTFFKVLVRKEENKVDKNTNLYGKLHLLSLEKYGKNEWWFYSKNNNTNVILLYVLLIFIWVPLLMMVSPLIGGIAFFLLRCFWVFWLSKSKLKETEEWAELIAYILWYRQFLKACDENQLRTFLSQDPLYFDKTLPYAVVFWLETEFLKKIEPIMQEMNIKPLWDSFDNNTLYIINRTISNVAINSHPQTSSYSSSGWFSSWSSFWWGGWGFSGWWGWWGGWWWSW